MLKERSGTWSELEPACIEEPVPADHLLRKNVRAIDFSFIYRKVERFYCAHKGRPPVDPVMLFVGYFFGIHSERRLVEGKTLCTGSTHLKASVDKEKCGKLTAEKSTRGYRRNSI